MIKRNIFLIAISCVCSNAYCEVTTSNSYCDIERVIAIKAQTLNQRNYPYELAIKDLQKGREKLSSSKKSNKELVFRIVQDAYTIPRVVLNAYTTSSHTEDSMKLDVIRNFSDVTYSKCLRFKHSNNTAYVE
jgi:hypothetical protein